MKKVTILLLIVIPIVLWMIVYSPTDPKSLFYQAWKRGIPLETVNSAFEAMIGDRNRLELVKGKNIEEIRRKFGHLRRDDLLPYQAMCVTNGGYKAKDLVFLGDSNWMVLFSNGFAIELILCKGM